MTTKPILDPDVERDAVTIQDLEDAVSQVLLAPAKGPTKSENIENREPTLNELNQRWKLTRQNEV